MNTHITEAILYEFSLQETAGNFAHWQNGYIAWILYLPLIGALFNGLGVPIFNALAGKLGGRRIGERQVALVGSGVIVLSFLHALIYATHLVRFRNYAGIRDMTDAGADIFSQTVYTWIGTGSLLIDVTFELTPLSMLMVLVITGVGALIHIYSTAYMKGDEGYARYFAYLNLFIFSMLVLVMGNSLPLLFVGWEGVGLCSYLLIGFWYEDMAKASAGKKAFIANRIGDFGVLLAMFILFREAGVLDYAGLRGATANMTPEMITLACLLLFLGATGKSAQIPLFVWLPDAMAGPTPVSALIHAATMVTAGVFMCVQLNFLFSASPMAMGVIAVVGALTALFAATIGLVQNDIKKVLAYSTVSQLGFMFLAVGSGAYWVAMFHVITHAFFKACLFLGSGSVIHGMSNEQDMRKMGGLGKLMPRTARTYFVSCLAISGFIGTSGFFSKDEILWMALSQRHISPHPVLLYLIGVIAAFCTAFYMFRSYYMTFSGECRADEETKAHIHESPLAMVFPLGMLALLALAGGLIGLPHAWGAHPWLEGWLEPMMGAKTRALRFMSGEHHALEIGLQLVGGVLIPFSGFYVARWFYKDAASAIPARLAARRAQLHKLLYNKYWVDEIYEAIVIRPVHRLSEFLSSVIDAIVIDLLLVRGVAAVSMSLGQAGTLWQNGNVQRYAATIAVGMLSLLAGMVLFGK